MGNSLKKFRRDESGQGLVEYALIIALVAVGLIVILTLLRNTVGNVFNASTDKSNAAGNSVYQSGGGGGGSQQP